MPPHAGDVAVLLIAHGSRHAPANEDLHQLAARLAARGPYGVVEASFLELAAPDIVTGGDQCVARGARRVLMVPYLLSAGVHLRRDLTAARDELEQRHPGVEFRLGPALGPHPLLDELVAERARQVDSGVPVSTSNPQVPDTSDVSVGPAPGADSSRIDTNRSSH